MQKVKELIPHLFTAGNLVGGIMAIFFIFSGGENHWMYASFAVIGSTILDFCDGFVARLLKVPSELGKQLDSLADMVTFGVVPGLLIYQYLDIGLMFESGWSQDYHDFYFWFGGIAFMIPIFAMFRLAKFNLDTRQTNSFIGLPTPAMTLFFISFPLLEHDAFSWNESELKIWIVREVLFNPWFLIAFIFLFSILMVVELPLFALKFKTFGWKGNEIRYVFLTISVILLATLFVWAIPIIIILYVILSIVNNLISRKPACR